MEGIPAKTTIDLEKEKTRTIKLRRKTGDEESGTIKICLGWINSNFTILRPTVTF